VTVGVAEGIAGVAVGALMVAVCVGEDGALVDVGGTGVCVAVGAACEASTITSWGTFWLCSRL
jgi:hypothetical protein